VCLGDEVIIDVINHLSSDSTTIHWHGHHQRNSPYMDGVPFVTQCPIHPGMTFRYHFNVHNVGTHFWHSHSGNIQSDLRVINNNGPNKICGATNNTCPPVFF
jgi:L-ascorbate oxidase